MNTPLLTRTTGCMCRFLQRSCKLTATAYSRSKPPQHFITSNKQIALSRRFTTSTVTLSGDVTPSAENPDIDFVEAGENVHADDYDFETFDDDFNEESTISTGGSVSQREMDRFRQLSSEWWRPGGNFDALRTMNEIRVPRIRDALLDGRKPVSGSKPLEGFTILDVGCGGGILSEPLARLGATVVGIDPLRENMESARIHALQDPALEGKLEYIRTTVEEHRTEERAQEGYDMVVASEVIEHVSRLDMFMQDCCSLIKPGGHMFVSTINRTLVSTLLAKYAAEYILRIVPPDTHDADKFVTPEELVNYMRKSDLVYITFEGLTLNPLTLAWSTIPSTAMNYICQARKLVT